MKAVGSSDRPVFEIEEVASFKVMTLGTGLYLNLQDNKDGSVVQFRIPMALNFNTLWRELKDGADGLLGRVYAENDFGHSVCVASQLHIRISHDPAELPRILGECDGVSCSPVVELPHGTKQMIIDYFVAKRRAI